MDIKMSIANTNEFHGKFICDRKPFHTWTDTIITNYGRIIDEREFHNGNSQTEFK